jgi:hypothetical protein
LLASEIFLEAPTIDPESFYRFVETPPDANGHVGYKVYDKETGMAITFRGENASTEAEEWIDKNDQRRKAKLLKQKQKQQRFNNKEQYKKVATAGYKKFLGGRTTYRLMKFITLAERGNNVLLYIRRYYAAYAENGCSEKRIETNKSRYGNRLVYDDMIYLKKKTADTIAEAAVQIFSSWLTGAMSTIVAIKICTILAAIFAITAPAAINNILIEQKRINEDLEQAKNAFLKIAEKLYNEIYYRVPAWLKSSIKAVIKYIKNELK